MNRLTKLWDAIGMGIEDIKLRRNVQALGGIKLNSANGRLFYATIFAGIQPDENVVDRLPAGDRWTHKYTGDKSYHSLDYLLGSSALAQKNKSVLRVIERRWQSLRVNQKNKPPAVKKFLPEIQGKAKAVNHCPVALTLKL